MSFDDNLRTSNLERFLEECRAFSTDGDLGGCSVPRFPKMGPSAGLL